MMKKIFNYIIIIFAISSCVEPYEPEINKYEELIVIDAELTNLTGPHQAIISKSYPYNSKNNQNKIINAIVKYIDELGNETILIDIKENGIYETDSLFQGIVGRKYKIHVEISDNVYESDFEELIRPLEIDSIYFSPDIKYSYDTENDIFGAQIYIDTHDPENNTFYYAWKYEETWKFNVPISHDYDKYFCYKSYYSKDLIIGTSENQNSDIIKQFPIVFVGNNTSRLSIKYSIQITQYTLSQKTYQFYKNIKSVNEGGGSIFGKTPNSVYGNVYNINDKSEPVLGLFKVSGESKKRIFITKADFEESFFVASDFAWCKQEFADVSDSIKADSILNVGYVIIDTNFNTMQIEFARDSACFDCTKSGTNIKPDFWVD